MFKKTKIAAVSAAILGLSSVAANAAMDGELSINEAGSAGQVLVYPYYNVNNAFVTRYNVINTTGDYKAIKVRFRESENSNDVLDFNLYLSPFDVYSVLLSEKDGGVVLKTSDKSCTHPAIPDEGVAFRHDAYASTSTADVREGYLEIIEMGVVGPDAIVNVVEGSETVEKSVTLDGILHVNGVPGDCTLIKQAWIDGVFTQGGAQSNDGQTGAIASDTVDPKPKTIYVKAPKTSETGFYGDEFPKNMLPPTGGLVGTSILVSLSNFSGYVAEPIAVENYSTTAQHYMSSDENFYLLPSLASGDVYETADGSFERVKRDWGLDDVNVLPRTSVPSGINPMPLADALLTTAVGNQYFLAEGEQSDWVISAPMRKHAVWNNYQYTVDGNYEAGEMVDTGEEDENGNPILLPVGDIPVGQAFGYEGAAGTYWKAVKGDLNASFIYFDREEGTAAPEDDDEFSPPLVTPPSEIPFESEVNILAFNTGNANDSVLGSDNAQGLTVKDGFVKGWGGLTFYSASDMAFDLDGGRYDAWTTISSSAPGVPVFGFLAVEADFGPGSVGETFPHFYNRVRTPKAD